MKSWQGNRKKIQANNNNIMNVKTTCKDNVSGFFSLWEGFIKRWLRFFFLEDLKTNFTKEANFSISCVNSQELIYVKTTSKAKKSSMVLKE